MGGLPSVLARQRHRRDPGSGRAVSAGTPPCSLGGVTQGSRGATRGNMWSLRCVPRLCVCMCILSSNRARKDAKRGSRHMHWWHAGRQQGKFSNNERHCATASRRSRDVATRLHCCWVSNSLVQCTRAQHTRLCGYIRDTHSIMGRVRGGRGLRGVVCRWGATYMCARNGDPPSEECIWISAQQRVPRASHVAGLCAEWCAQGVVPKGHTDGTRDARDTS